MMIVDSTSNNAVSSLKLQSILVFTFKPSCRMGANSSKTSQ